MARVGVVWTRRAKWTALLVAMPCALGVAFASHVVSVRPAAAVQESVAVSATEEEQLAALQDSSELEGEALVSGVLTTSSGAAAPSGTPVYVEVWPTPEELAAQAVGTAVDLVPVGKGLVGTNGSFAVRIDPRVDLVGLMGQSNFIDATLVASSGDHRSTYEFSIGRAAQYGTVDGDQALPEVAVYDTSSRLTTQGPAVQLELGGVGRLAGLDATGIDEDPASVVDGVEEPESVGVSAEAEAAGCVPGGTRKVADLGGKWVNVGHTFASGGSGKKIRYEYSGTADSSLGVGVKVGDAYEQSGTVTRERRLSISWGEWEAPKRRYLDTQFDFAKYCWMHSSGASYQYSVKATTHSGGARHRILDSYPSYLTKCKSWSAGSSGSKHESNSISWNSGVKIESTIGINLSSRTGYRTDSELHWEFNTSGRLCGKDTYPYDKPRIIGMKGA